MKYQGSKRRFAKEIIATIEMHLPKDKTGLTWYEPFVGGANLIDKVKGYKRIGSDKNKYLISYLQAISSGWLPPESVTEEQYHEIKNNRDADPKLSGFAGFALSFGAKFFCGYARSEDRNRANEGRNNAKKQAPNLENVQFLEMDYQHSEIIVGAKNVVYYLDPPYKGTEGYKVGSFDHEQFYAFCRRLKVQGAFVFVSEYTMPEDFICIWERERQPAA